MRNALGMGGLARLAFAGTAVVLATTLAFAKTAEQCQADYDKASYLCYANPDTTQMDTPTDVRYCLQRAKNKFNNCMSNATMSTPSGLMLEPASRPKPPRTIAPGLLDNTAVLSTIGPAPTGTPLAPAPSTSGRIN